MLKSKLAVSGLVLSLLVSGCRTIRLYEVNPPDVQTRQHVRELATKGEEQGKWVDVQGRLKTALKASSAAPSDSNAANQYLAAGVTVADLYCRQFLKILSEQQADNEAVRGAFNVADAATSAALGLANVSTGVVSGASIGFSSIEALFETFDAAYLVSPEIDQVEALVFEARDVLYGTIFEDNGPDNYYEAERRLAAYHNLCTFNGIKRVVNEAVANGQPVMANDATPALDALRALGGAGGVGVLGGGGVVADGVPGDGADGGATKSLVVRVR